MAQFPIFYRVPGQERLAARLIANSFADTAFFLQFGGGGLRTRNQDWRGAFISSVAIPETFPHHHF